MLSHGKILTGKNNDLGIVIQARMGSRRLPGKVLKKIGNDTLLEHIISRLKLLKHKAGIIIATSDLPIDNVIEDLCMAKGINCFRGSEKNVLERYYLCAKKYGFRHIVRLTGDNPFTDIEELDNLIALHFYSGADYTNSFEFLPIGVGAEIFAFSALEKVYREGRQAQHIEHVNEYIIENPSMFKCSVLGGISEKHRHDIRLTVDTEEDYDKACYIMENSKYKYISTPLAIKLAEKYRSKNKK